MERSRWLPLFTSPRKSSDGERMDDGDGGIWDGGVAHWFSLIILYKSAKVLEVYYHYHTGGWRDDAHTFGVRLWTRPFFHSLSPPFTVSRGRKDCRQSKSLSSHYSYSESKYWEMDLKREETRKGRGEKQKWKGRMIYNGIRSLMLSNGITELDTL